MKNLKSKWMILGMMVMLVLTGCQKSDTGAKATGPAPEPIAKEADTKLTVAAAASLEYAYVEKLIPMFEEKNPSIKIEGVYDSSGKLQTQIEEGLEADLFMSAAMKQMKNLSEKQMVDKESIVELLENKIVLIKPVDSETKVTDFKNISEATTIAIGDPESVPVGEYAKEALENLKIWDGIQSKLSLGTNVTEVLNWVAENSAEVGIVYATDAATTDKVKILAEAPEGSLKKKVIYPVGIVSASKNKEAAQKFLEFLSSDEALQVFKDYGFTPNK